MHSMQPACMTKWCVRLFVSLTPALNPHLNPRSICSHRSARIGMKALPSQACASHSCLAHQQGTERRCFQPFRQTRPVRKACHKRTCALVAERAQTVENLQKWCRDSKTDIQLCNLVLKQGQAAISTSAGAQAGQTLLTIPQSEWITVELVSKSRIGTAVSHLDGWLQLALFILHSCQQANSPASGFFLSLPETLNVPLLWSDDELSLLDGTQILSTVQGYRGFFEDTWHDLKADIFDRDSGLFPSDVYSFDNFLWAVATLRSRVHPPLQGDQVAMVPLADLVQHSRSGNCQWKVQQAGFGQKRQKLSLESTTNLSTGESLSMDYGPDKTDTQILLDYGTMDTDSPQPGFLLPLAIPEGDSNYDDKADIVELNGLQESYEFTLHPDRPPDKAMIAFLRLTNIQGADAFLMEALFRNEVWGFMQLPVSRENEAAACQSMVDGCRDALRSYPTSINEDLAMLRDTQLSVREELAIRARLGEKETLDVTLRFFEDRQSKLNALEYYQERRLKGLGLMDDDGDSTWDGFFKDSIA